MNFDKKFFLGIILLVFIFTISSVSAEDLNEDYQLDNSSMEITQVSSQQNSDDAVIVSNWGELKTYCEKTDKNYVIQLKENTNFYPTDGSDSSNQIMVRNNATILGNTGAYFGDKSSVASTIYYTPIKTPENSNISLKLINLEFKWMILSQKSSRDSGMFVELAGDCTGNLLENCTFDNITSLSSHACVYYLKRGYATVKNCSFTNINTCFGVLSLYDPDAGLASNTTHMLVENSYFENNYATTEPGCINNCGQLIVKNSTFYKNGAFWWAGAIHTHSGANASIYNSNFTDNVAGWNGGALYTYSYLQIYNSTFSGNNCTTNNGGGAIGACFYGSSPHIYIENSLFEYNTNNCWSITNESDGTGRGGAISIMDKSDLDVYNTTFIANSASIGTAICANQAHGYGSPNVRLVGNKFINHTKFGDVLVIDLSNSELVLSNNYYYNNSMVFSKSKISEEDRIGNTTIINIQYSLKNSNYYDADILSKSGYLVYVDNVYLKTVYTDSFNLTFDDNKEHIVRVCPIVGSTYSNNLTVNGIPVQYIYVSVNGNDNNNGSKNSPVRTIAKAISLNTNGIYILGGNYNEYGLNISNDLKIVGEGNVFIGGVNSASAIFNITNNANVIFNNLKFSNVSGEIINGLSAGEIDINNCEFTSNINAEGMLVNVDKLVITDSKFKNNNVFKGIYANYLEMMECEFINNTATNSEGTLIYISVKDQKGVITKSVFENNTVHSGCIYLNDNGAGFGLDVSDSTFINNNAGFRGGCFFTTSSGSAYPIKISSSIFINNYAKAGSVLHDNKKGVITVVNSIFLNNTNTQESLGDVFSRVGTTGTFTLNANWWGNTDKNANTFPLKRLVSGGTLDNWLFLNITSSTSELKFNENAIITIDLSNLITSKGVISKYDDAGKLPLNSFNITSIGGKAIPATETFVNGKLQVIFTPTATGSASVTADIYGIKDTLNFTISKADTNLNLQVKKEINAGDDLVIKVFLDESKPTGNVTVTIGENNYTINLVNGVGNTTASNLASGNYTIKAKYNGDDNYNSAVTSANLTVNKIPSSMSVNITIGTLTTIIATLPNDAEGIVTFIIDGIETKTGKINKGRAYTILSSIGGGIHTVRAVYGGDNKYLGCEVTEQFSKDKLNSTLAVSTNNVKVGEDLLISVIVTPAPGSDEASVNITVGDISEIVKVNKDTGKASVTISDLKAGNYTIKAVYSGTGLYNPCENTTKVTIYPYPTPQWDNDGFDTSNTGKTNYTGNSNGGAIWSYVVSGSQINGSIAIDNAGNIYVAANDGIYSFTSNGTLRWKFEGVFGLNIQSGIAISRDIIISPKSGDTIYFINSTTGKKYGYSNIYQASSNFSPIVDENANIYISGEYQYSSKSYNLVIVPYNMWKYGGTPTMISLGAEPISAPTLLSNGLVAVNTKDGLKIINVTSKTVIGSFVGYGVVGRPVADSNNVIYVFDKDAKVTALSINNILWSSQIAINGSSLVLDEENGVLYTVGSNGVVYKISTFNKGETSEFYKLGASASSIMMDNNGTIYIGSDNGVISAIDSNANLLWTFATNSPVKGPIVMDKNGTIYAYSNKTIYGLGLGKATPAINVTVNDIKVGMDAIINIELPRDATGNVSVTIGNITKTDNIKDGKASISINNLSAGKYTAIIQYTGDNKYNPVKTNASFNVDKYESKVDISVDNIGIGKTAIVNITVTPGATGNVEVIINGKSQTLDLKDSKASVSIENLTNIDYKIEAIYNGDVKYLTSKANYTFNVNKINSSVVISVKDIKVGEDAVIVASVTSGATGNVTFVIGDKTETVNINDGIASLTLKDLASGNYTVKVTYNGDAKYLTSTNTTSFKVSKISGYDIKINDSDINEGENATIIINLPDDATGNVSLVINNRPYFVKVENGVAKIIIPYLSAGTHKFIVTYYGDNKYEKAAANGTITVNKKSYTLTADDLEKYYKGPENLTAKLVDNTGSPIANAEIAFNIKGKDYFRKTNEQGIASMAINLVAGTYNIAVKYNDTSVNVKVVVKSTIEAKDLVKMYQNDTQFYAKFLDSNGNPIVNRDVTFNINGVFYTRQTDANGQAKLSINLRPDTYILTATNPANGEEVGFNVLVKSLIEASDLTKYYLNASKFQATIYNKDGSLAANKEVTFNINGVFYKRTADDNGVVSLAINLRPENYTITTMYDGLEVGNKVNVLPTLVTKDLSMKFQDGSKFQVKTLDGQGMPLANQNITFNVNGVFYHKTTGDDGIASLNINLMAGEYIITSMWNDFQIGNTIKISP